LTKILTSFGDYSLICRVDFLLDIGIKKAFEDGDELIMALDMMIRNDAKMQTRAHYRDETKSALRA